MIEGLIWKGMAALGVVLGAKPGVILLSDELPRVASSLTAYASFQFYSFLERSTTHYGCIRPYARGNN